MTTSSSTVTGPDRGETIQVPLPRFTEASCDDCEWTGKTATGAWDHSVTAGHSTRVDVINRTLFSRTSGGDEPLPRRLDPRRPNEFTGADFNAAQAGTRLAAAANREIGLTDISDATLRRIREGW